MRCNVLLLAIAPAFANVPVGPPQPTQNEAITVVTMKDMAIGDAPPRLVMRISEDDYKSVVRLVMSRGRPVAKSDKLYGYRDSYGNTHDVTVVIKPDTGPAIYQMAMELQVKAFGSRDAFSYTITQNGRVEHDCGCKDSTPMIERAKHDIEIRSAVEGLIKLSHEVEIASH